MSEAIQGKDEKTAMIRRMFLKSLFGVVSIIAIPGTALAAIAAKKPKPFTGTIQVLTEWDATTCTIHIKNLVFVDGVLQTNE